MRPITSQTAQEEKPDEQNPQALKKALENLIKKSKALLEALEEALEKIDKVELEKEFWRKHYFMFKESCEKYILAKGLEPFEYICNLEDKVKNLLVEKKCREEEKSFFNRSREQTPSLRNYNRSRELASTFDRKSFSTISFSKDSKPPAKDPKKICLFKYSTPKQPKIYI